MKTLFFFTTILLQFTFLVNAQTSSKDLSQVEIGMKRNDVFKLVGKPDKSYFNQINDKKDSMIWDVYAGKTVLYISNKVLQIQNSSVTVQKSKTDSAKSNSQQKKSVLKSK
jgi:hypothetical protein